jgi:hypothetical protein
MLDHGCQVQRHALAEWIDHVNQEPWFDHVDKEPLLDHIDNLNRTRWYARLHSEQRLAFLDWVIAKRQAELDARAASATAVDLTMKLVGKPDAGNRHVRCVAAERWLTNRLAATLSQIRRQRIIELRDREPLPDWYQDYRRYLHSGRWRRIRLRKLVSARYRCEQPGCKRSATACHHKHYDTLGFEENADLEALCVRHHQARHSGSHQGQQPRRRKVCADVVDIRAYADALTRAASAAGGVRRAP